MSLFCLKNSKYKLLSVQLSSFHKNPDLNSNHIIYLITKPVKTLFLNHYEIKMSASQTGPSSNICCTACILYEWNCLT